MGIDVSEFQGEEIDWKRVKKSGVEFAIIRLGYRAYGESGDLVMDAMYEQNMEGALDAGLDVGVYFFSQAISAAEAVEEAEFVLENVKNMISPAPSYTIRRRSNGIAPVQTRIQNRSLRTTARYSAIRSAMRDMIR